MKIGIFGGTFDPIHNGHLKIAKAACGSLSLDKLIFIPCLIPPHKPGAEIAPSEHRLEMVKLAIEGMPKYEVSGYEIMKPGVSYTIDTLGHFKSAYPGAGLYLVIGSDSYLDLPTWKKYKKIPKIATLAVVLRPGFEGYPKDRDIAEIPMDPAPVSSSDIRAKLKRGKSVNGDLPERVFDYIQKKKLYAGLDKS